MVEEEKAHRLRELLATIKRLAIEYYRLTGKPLGVTGEVAEYVAAETLGLELAPPRTAGHDALRQTPEGPVRVQIKGRAFDASDRRSQRIGTIKRGAACDVVILVLLDSGTLDACEIWEAPYQAVIERLQVPGSRARERGQLSVSEFKKLARRVWP